MSVSEHTGAEEFMDAQIQIAEVSPAAEKSVHECLEKMPGVERVTLLHETVTILYDPTRVTREDLEQALAQAGVQVKKSETHRESPIAEIEDKVAPFLEREAPPGKES